MQPTFSLIIPVYKNSANLPALLSVLQQMSTELNNNLELVFVVDGSPDDSLQQLQAALPDQTYSAQLIALSRNFGSFAAIRCGLELAKGRYFAVMAADLQEPPELIQLFFKALESDEADIVLGQREKRHDGRLNGYLSNSFWTLYRKLVLRDIPFGGVDIFACNRKARAHLLCLNEANSSLISQLFWIGHRRLFIPYTRRPREHGKSAWSVQRKVRYMLDSIFSFSDFPIFLLLWLGGLGILATILIGLIILLAWLVGAISVPGYTPIMLLISLIGSVLIFGQGIIGCYVWRAAENTKQRPLTIIHSQQSFSPVNNGS